MYMHASVQFGRIVLPFRNPPTNPSEITFAFVGSKIRLSGSVSLYYFLLLLLSAAPIYQGLPQRMFSNIRTENLAVFYAGCSTNSSQLKEVEQMGHGSRVPVASSFKCFHLGWNNFYILETIGLL